eukprot:scaffold18216_cov91-Isochrysis_galbana.AAC.2
MPAGNNSVTESKPRKIALRPTLTQQDGPFLCCRRRRCLGSRPLTKKEPTALIGVCAGCPRRRPHTQPNH